LLVDNIEQHQCHTSWDNTRFKKNPLSPTITDCAGTAIGKISSPIMNLTWNFDAQEYGQGTCSPSGSAQDAQKDFCVTMIVRGRLDPRMSGGLIFLQGVDFIKVGDFNMVVRAVGDKMSVKDNTGDEFASNLSAESVALEEPPTPTTNTNHATNTNTNHANYTNYANYANYTNYTNYTNYANYTNYTNYTNHICSN
jgi:hypothetical protein